ncbi:hypothetical protein ACXN5S_02575 [Pseudoroseicyclus sp. H15]
MAAPAPRASGALDARRRAPVLAMATAGAVALTAALVALSPGAMAQNVPGAPPGITPVFSIWDVHLGEPVSQIDPRDVAEIACGTNGGPPSLPLDSFGDWQTCPVEEETGLREVYFTYDDEEDYIARALELEYQVLRGGTSVFANPVMVSILVDDEGLAQGIRIITDDRVSDMDRRNAVALARNFEARYSGWNLDCEDIPPREGEMPVGNQFTHYICTGTDPEGSGATLKIEASYLRKRGQVAINRETQSVNSGYFESRTAFQLLTAAAS